MKVKLVIIGASGHGKVVADIAIKMKKWQHIVFLDDDDTIKTCLGFDRVGNTSDAFKYKEEADFFVAIGNNATREKVQKKLEEESLSIASLVHPSAIIGTDVIIGVGTAVMAGVVINSSSSIAKGCIINTSSSVDHDNIIEAFVHVSPGAHLAGTVSVGRRSWLGIGCVVSNNVNICSDCRVGAGAVVIGDIIETGTYVGVPVRRVEI